MSVLPAFKLFVHYAKMTLFPSVTDVKCWLHGLLIPFLVPLHNATVTISNSFTTLFIGSRHIHTSETNQHCYSFLLFIFSFISLSHYYLLTHTQKKTLMWIFGFWLPYTYLRNNVSYIITYSRRNIGLAINKKL